MVGRLSSRFVEVEDHSDHHQHQDQDHQDHDRRAGAGAGDGEERGQVQGGEQAHQAVLGLDPGIDSFLFFKSSLV